MALLRVKLGGEYIVLGQCRSKVHAVVAASGHLRRLARTGVVAVHEVEAGVLLDAVPERVVDGLGDLVPAHVRHLQTLTLLLQRSEERRVGKVCRSGWSA